MVSAKAQSKAKRDRADLPWRLLQATALVVLALVVLRYGLSVARFFHWALACPYEVEYGEGILLRNALNIAHGRALYHNFHHYPFTVATYPPVYPLLSAVGVWLMGPSFFFGRLLSMLAAGATGFFIFLMLRRAGVSPFGAAFGAMLFLGAPAVPRWAIVMRVDMVAVAFGAAGLYFALRGGRWLWVAVAMLVLAAYTRQSQVGPLVASVVYLLWSRRTREALLLAGGFGLVSLAVLAALQIGSHGWFYQHVIVANMNLWEYKRLVDVWSWAFPTWRWPFLIGAAGCLFALLAPAPAPGEPPDTRNRPERLFLLYFLCAMALSITAGKVGSYVNYMLEPIAAAALMAGVCYEHLARWLGAGWRRVVWVPLWLLMVAPPARVLATPGRTPYEPYDFQPPAIMAAGQVLVPLLRATRGDIISEDTGLLLITGHEILLDPHKMSSMSRDGNWDPTELLADINRRRFRFVILTWNPLTEPLDQWNCYGWYRWTKGMGDAIKRNYYLVLKAGYLYLLAPADARHPSVQQVLDKGRQKIPAP